MADEASMFFGNLRILAKGVALTVNEVTKDMGGS
jgi:hypothetical protein